MCDLRPMSDFPDFRGYVHKTEHITEYKHISELDHTDPVGVYFVIATGTSYIYWNGEMATYV